MVRAWLLVGGAAAVLAGCGGSTDADRAASASVAAGATGLEAGGAKPDDFAPPQPALGSGLDRIALLTAALDDDPGQEQIAAFRPTGSMDGPIRVGVIDYQDDGVSWRMIWEAETQALDPDTLQIAMIDLVDDPAPEIVVRGTAGSDRQTLDAYQLVPAAQGAATQGAAKQGVAKQGVEGFRTIARIAVHGTLTIEDPGGGRHAGGEERGEDAAALPLVAYVKAPDSESGLDLLRLTYGWDTERARYVLLRTEPVSAPADPESRLLALYSTPGVDPYEAFLAGPWYRDDPSGPDDAGGPRELIVFAPDERLISIYDGEILEQLEWVASHRPLLAHLDVWTRNLAIEVIARTFGIEAQSAAEIRIQVRGHDPYAGVSSRTYRRLTPAAQETLLAARIPAPVAILSGHYRSADGLSLEFLGDRFVWADGAQVFEGGFALRGRLLSMKIIGPRGTHRGYLSFLIDYAEESSSDGVERSLRLTPVGPDSPRAPAAGAKVLHLHQVQPVTDRSRRDTE